MKTRAIAMLALLAAPISARAQDPLRPVGPFHDAPFTITPFIGVQAPHNTGDYFLFVPSEGTSIRTTEQRAGGPLAGIELAVRAWGPLSVMGSVAAASLGQTTITLNRADESESYTAPGADVVLSRAALAYRLPAPNPDNRRLRPSGYIFAGPALVRTSYEDDADFGIDGTTNNWGANFGFQATADIGSGRVAVNLGVEDFLTFWNDDRVRERDTLVFGSLFEEDVTINYDSSTSNLIVLRAGISIRF